MNEDNNVYKLHEYVAHSTKVNCLTLGPQSIQVLATGGEDSTINLWRIDNAVNIWTLKQKSSIECLSFDCNEEYLCSGAINGSLKIFDLNEGKLARNLRGHQVHVTSVHYHPYGEFIVSGSYDHTMKVWDIRNKSCVQTFTGHEHEITCTKFSPDGRWVTSSAKDGKLLIWDLVAGKLLTSIKLTQNSHLTSFEFNPNEFLLAGATNNRSVRFWDLEIMEEIGHTTPDSTAVRSICYAENGTNLCTANNEYLRLWNWDPSVTLLHNYSIGWDRIQEMKVCNHNPTEHLIAISSNSNFVSIWDVDIGALHEQSLSSVEVSEDRGIVVGTRDRSNSNRKSNTPASTSTRSGNGSDDDNDSYSGGGGAGGNGVNLKPALKVDGYFSSPEKKPGVLETVPEVQWEGGHSTDELAAVISASKYRQEHHESHLQEERGAKRTTQNSSNIPVVVKEDDERVIHDRFVPSTNQRKRPVTREKEREKKNEKTKFEVIPANPPAEIGLSVVGRPMTSLDKDREKREDSPPKQTKYVVNTSENKRNIVGQGSDLDRVEQGHERDSRLRDRDRDRDRGDRNESNGKSNVRRIHSESNVNHASQTPLPTAVPMAVLKRDSSLQSLPSQQQPVGSIPNNDHQLIQHEIDTYLTLVLTQSDLTSTILQQRYEILRQLQTYWRNSDLQAISDTLLPLLNSIPIQSDSFSSTISINSTPSLSLLLVFSDFMNSIDFHSSIITLSTCPIFLSLFYKYLQELIKSTTPPIPSIMISILQSTLSLYQIFHQIIYETRLVGLVSHGNIDMAREERLERCNNCYKLFYQIRSSSELLREKYRKNRDIIEQFQQGLGDLEY